MDTVRMNNTIRIVDKKKKRLNQTFLGRNAALELIA